MKKRFKGIKFKLLFAVSAILVIAVATVDLLLFLKTKEYGINLVKTNESRLTSQIARGIDKALDAGDLVFFYISINTDVIKIISDNIDEESSEYVQSNIVVSEQLNSLLYVSESIVAITLINNSGGFYCLGIHKEIMGNYLEEQWFQDFAGTDETRYFSKVHTMVRNLQGASLEKKTVQTISYIRKIIDPKNPSKTIGTIIISYNVSTFKSIMSDGVEPGNSYILLNNKEIVLSQGKFSALPENLMIDDNQSGETNNQIYASNKQYIVIKNPLNTSNFTLYSFVSIENVNVEVSKITFFATSIGIIVAALFCIIFIPIANGIIRPLLRLNKAVKSVAEGNFDISVETNTNDEIQELSDSLNNMTQKIKLLIQRVKTEEKSKNDAQMQFLMAQVNPHFVYNTLNSVIYLARQKKTGEIIKLVSAFITLLQKTIKPKNYFIKVQDEMDLLSAYVAIQSYRYGDVIDLIFKIPEAYHNKLIPSMVIQPIVENAIVHGILPTENKCRIIVQILIDDENTTIKVKNKGVSISQEKLDAIRNSLGENNNSNSGIALKNIYTRINILYNNQAELFIDALPDGGSEVIIKIRHLEVNTFTDNSYPQKS